jgi:hypothetical protein
MNSMNNVLCIYEFLNIIDYDFAQKFTERKNKELVKFKHIVEKYKESKHM